MRRNLFTYWPVVMLVLLAVAAPARAVCTAANANANVIESTPTSDFAAFTTADVTVTHNKTGLMWSRCSVGQTWDASGNTCTGTPITLNRANALAAANTANAAALGGFTDWRLPNVKELESIVELCGYFPAINLLVFPATPASNFWSGSSYVPYPAGAWNVFFSDGNTDVGYKTDGKRVRLVRGGQSLDSFDLVGPTVTAISPTSGSTVGGTAVTITGTNLTGASVVTIGGAAATSVIVVNATTITASTPAGSAGPASVLVTTPGGTNAANTLYTYVTPITDLAIAMRHSGNFGRGHAGATYTITVSSIGGLATDGSLVSVTDTLPVGLSATALTGSGWACVLGTLTCTRSDVLGGSASYPAITLTVSVAANAPPSIVNSASVSGGGDANAGNNTVTDTTTTVPGLVSILYLLLD